MIAANTWSDATWQLVGVTASGSTWDAATGTWTVSASRGEWTGHSLTVQFKNTGGDVITYRPYINGKELQNYVAKDVLIQTTGNLEQLAAGQTGYVTFTLSVGANAAAGTLPDVTLEIK